MGKTIRNNSSKETNKFVSNKNTSKKQNKEKRPNNNQFKKLDYSSSDYD
jgi:hypothetical protein